MPYIKGPNFLSVAEHRLLPTHLVVRTKPTTHRLDLLDELLRRVGKIQLLVFAVAIPLLVILDISGGTNIERRNNSEVTGMCVENSKF